ncbi:MAG: sulfite oxidase, partial [Polaromonas sp.]
MIDTPASLPRRHLLASSAGALAAVGLATWTRGTIAQTTPIQAAKPLPALVSWKDPVSVIVHGSTTVETKRGAFGTSVITPADQLYLRNNLPSPDASIVADRD